MSSRFARIRAALEQTQLDEATPVRQAELLPSGRRRIEAKVIQTTSLPSKPSIDEDTGEDYKIDDGESELEPTSISISKPFLPLQQEQEVNQDEEEELDKEDEQDGPLFRPIFVPKSQRSEDISLPGTVEEEGNRTQEAHKLLVQLVRKEYEASVRLPGHGNNDNELEADYKFDPAMVDDTDGGPNEEEEYEAWKLRELLRLKRDREERDRWELERMELERIRNLTEEERRRLDEEKMKEWLERAPAGQMRFMQKYYHKGAFFMDREESLYQRDYQQPTGEDAAANREMLPEVKQVRDWGKKGRTKWTHLVGEDTTAFDYGWGQRKNEMNYKLISQMGGMRGHLDNPSAKRSKPE